MVLLCFGRQIRGFFLWNLELGSGLECIIVLVAEWIYLDGDSRQLDKAKGLWVFRSCASWYLTEMLKPSSPINVTRCRYCTTLDHDSIRYAQGSRFGFFKTFQKC